VYKIEMLSLWGSILFDFIYCRWLHSFILTRWEER